MSQEMMTAIHRNIANKWNPPPYRKNIMERRVPLQNRALLLTGYPNSYSGPLNALKNCLNTR